MPNYRIFCKDKIFIDVHIEVDFAPTKGRKFKFFEEEKSDLTSFSLQHFDRKHHLYECVFKIHYIAIISIAFTHIRK